MAQEYKYKVCTRCMTFNHAPFIEDAMRSFCSQQTTFNVVYAIVDDASTDGTQESIRRFLDEQFNLSDTSVVKQENTPDYELVFAQHKENHNCFFLTVFLKYNHYSIKKPKDLYFAQWQENAQYIAMCEGDDYWIREDKLQKQVDYLDKHTAYSAHTTNSMIIDESGMPHGNFSNKQSRLLTNMDEIVIKRQFHTASVVWRNCCFNEQYSQFRWDTYYWCSLMSKGGIWYDDSVTCVYRKAGQGVTSTTARLKWIETNENWSNILYEQFSPKELSYTGAYISLTRDILTSLIQGGLIKDEKALLIRKYMKYSNMKMNMMNIPFILKLYRDKVIRMIKKR